MRELKQIQFQMSNNRTKKNNILVGDGLGTDWMRMSKYCELLGEKGGPKSHQAGYARVLSGTLERKIQYDVVFVREPRLKKGTRKYDLYFGTRTAP